MTVQHMVQAAILVDPLDSRDIPRFGHHTYGMCVPIGVGTNLTAFMLADVLTNLTESKLLTSIDESVGQASDIVQRHSQNVIGKSLGRLGANPRELLHLGNQRS